MSEFLTFAGILIAILLALLAWAQANRVSHRADAIQERLAAVEEARREDELAEQATASLSVEFVEHGRNSKRLVVHNFGPARARGIDLVLDCNEKDGPWLHAAPFPDLDLLPGQTFEIPAMTAGATPPSVNGTLSWTDDGGRHEIAVRLST